MRFKLLVEDIDNISNYWSKETAHPSYRDKYDSIDKSSGHCAVTALLVNDLYGYDIYDVMVGRSRHFFNKDENGQIVDLTAKQFGNQTIPYEQGRLRNRKDLLKSKDVRDRYELLKSKYMNGEDI